MVWLWLGWKALAIILTSCHNHTNNNTLTMAATGPCSPETPKISSNDGSTAAKAGLASATAVAAAKTAATTIADANASEEAQHSKSMLKSSEEQATDANANANAPLAVTDTNNVTIMPSYHSTKQSKAYILANQLLKSGSLDDALATLEMALQFTREMVANIVKAGNNNNFKSDDHDNDIVEEDAINIDLHESLAPLHYLYGTTLLYSVEESDVMMAPDTGSNLQQQPQGGDDGAAEQDNFEVVPEEDEEEDQAPEVEEEDYEDNEEGGQDEAAPTVEDAAEDMQIAWENLDLARSIVSKLVEKFPNSYHASEAGSNASKTVLKSNTPTTHPPTKSSSDYYTPEQQRELLLDLAQIHTRLGDIQRSNDNILSCIDDYQHALTLRLETLGNYHQKVADSHFSLAAIYAQAPNQMGVTEGRVNMFMNSLGGGGGGGGGGDCGGSEDDNHEGTNGGEGGLTEEEKAQYRQRSLEHYFACGVAFAGMLAQMCEVDPDQLTAITDISSFESSSAGTMVAASASAGNASFSTTTTTSMVYTQAMLTLRQRISTLAQQSTVFTALSQEDKENFTNVQEMMDEIQEAMDSAKETEAGLKTLSEMKANEIKKHELKLNGGDDAEEVNGCAFGVGGVDGGVTTTIGFASGTIAAATATGTTTSEAAAGPTMMVVKKKKKQHLPQAGVAGAEEDSSTKRAKTN